MSEVCVVVVGEGYGEGDFFLGDGCGYFVVCGFNEFFLDEEVNDFLNSWLDGGLYFFVGYFAFFVALCCGVDDVGDVVYDVV